MDAQYDAKSKLLTLTVPVDPAQGVRSASGKTMVLFSTRGNKPLPHVGENVYIGLNIYKK